MKFVVFNQYIGQSLIKILDRQYWYLYYFEQFVCRVYNSEECTWKNRCWCTIILHMKTFLSFKIYMNQYKLYILFSRGFPYVPATCSGSSNSKVCRQRFWICKGLLGFWWCEKEKLHCVQWSQLQMQIRVYDARAISDKVHSL